MIGIVVSDLPCHSKAIPLKMDMSQSSDGKAKVKVTGSNGAIAVGDKLQATTKASS
jgi:hypothetical protein